ncbi:hypothetical protein PVAND_008971 [Polypedilum vanderplanki]|uniref:guanylate kinase n=1 Tax=Polypedilum vanderplanki TaxID=319348 RepID=A0A9J6CCC9_POLVA|nr:hypothetical protein PVAND_008971 [Polypedilum vanderplanki]
MLSVTVLIARALSTLNNKMKPASIRPLVICGPSGSGKSTLLKRLFKEFPKTFGFSVSHTTRKPRSDEEDGVHYYFVNADDMKEAIKAGEFIETAVFSGNIYGTSKKAIERVQQDGKVCVLDIEIEGVKQVKNSHLNAIFVFIQPPSIEELERRLRARKTETEESLQKRLNTAKQELAFGLQPGNFDIIIKNHNLKQAYHELRDFVYAHLINQKEQGLNVCVESMSLDDSDFMTNLD